MGTPEGDEHELLFYKAAANQLPYITVTRSLLGRGMRIVCINLTTYDTLQRPASFFKTNDFLFSSSCSAAMKPTEPVDPAADSEVDFCTIAMFILGTYSAVIATANSNILSGQMILTLAIRNLV